MNREELIALEGRLETVKDWMNGLRMVAAHPIARQAAIHMTVIEAALTALQDEAGMVSVPREPTAEMRQAGVDAWAMKDSHAYESVVNRIYRAMLSAAPAPADQVKHDDASGTRWAD